MINVNTKILDLASYKKLYDFTNLLKLRKFFVFTFSVFLIFIMIYLSACTYTPINKKPQNLKGFAYWQGSWKAKTKSGSIFYEKWKIVDEKLMLGEGYELSPKNDTLFTEVINLYMQSEDSIVYAVSINNQKMKCFGMINNFPDNAIFYNKDNEYPKYICYKKADINIISVNLCNEFDSNIENLQFKKVSN